MDLMDFELFISNYERDIYNFCYHLTMDKFTADDLYQDTIIEAFNKLEKINIDKNPKSFLLSIAVGKWRNEKSKFFRRSKIMVKEGFNELSEDEPSKEYNVEDIVLKQEMNDLIKKALYKIDDKYRIPMILYYLEGNKLDVISKTCKIPIGTVKSRLSKGRELMKNMLKELGAVNYE